MAEHKDVATSRLADELPISLVAHTVYCPRRAWLESVGESVPSAPMEQGQADHNRVNAHADERSEHKRSVPISHQKLNIVGICDVVEGKTGAPLRVVEYKSSPIRRKPVVTHAQVIQLALQGMCLRDMGYTVESYGVYFTTHHRSVEVTIGEKEQDEAIQYATQTRAIVESREAPAALIDDPRCDRCSHAGVCLPDERKLQPTRRRFTVDDPDGHVLHLTTAGSRASISQGRVTVSNDKEKLGTVPIEQVQGLIIHGNVDVSSGLLRELLWRDVPVVWCSFKGRVVGFASGAHSPNGLARCRALELSSQQRLELCREFVASKIANQATQLRRGSREGMSAAVTMMRAAQRRCEQAGSLNELLGCEGEAAAHYFAGFPQLIVGQDSDFYLNKWRGRTGRNSDDPLNVCLNYVYGLLLGDTIRALLACGLDPNVGYLHTSARNKPALALDLMEQCRPVVADSAVIRAINNRELQPWMFSFSFGSCRMRDAGRQSLIRAYEQRAEQEFTHPLFGYRVSWRRAIEVQARLVLGVIDGTQPRYVGIRMR